MSVGVVIATSKWTPIVIASDFTARARSSALGVAAEKLDQSTSYWHLRIWLLWWSERPTTKNRFAFHASSPISVAQISTRTGSELGARVFASASSGAPATVPPIAANAMPITWAANEND